MTNKRYTDYKILMKNKKIVNLFSSNIKNCVFLCYDVINNINSENVIQKIKIFSLFFLSKGETKENMKNLRDCYL